MKRLLIALTCGGALSACRGVQHMYAGGELAEDQIALVRETGPATDWVAAMSLMNLREDGISTRIHAVDGEKVRDTAEAVGLLPGMHAIEASAVRSYEGLVDEDLCFATLLFDARGGVTYELQALPPEHTSSWALSIVATGSAEVLATTDVPLERVKCAELTFDGRTWVVGDWGTDGFVDSVTFVLATQSLDDWTEIVETQYVPAPDGPPDLGYFVSTLEEQLRESATEVTLSITEQDAETVVYEWSGIMQDTGEPESGVNCLRATAHGAFLFVYSTKLRPLPHTAATTWAAIFKRAHLLERP